MSENEGTGEVNIDDVDRDAIKLSGSVSNVGKHSNKSANKCQKQKLHQ